MLPLTQLHDDSLSWLDTGTSIKSGRVKLVLWAQTSSLSEMIQSCSCFLFRPFGFIAPKTLIYLAFQSFDCKHTCWRLFQKRVARTKFDIYVFISILLYNFYSFFSFAVYSQFALFEYMVVLSNIAFHWTMCIDFEEFSMNINKYIYTDDSQLTSVKAI